MTSRTTHVARATRGLFLAAIAACAFCAVSAPAAWAQQVKPHDVEDYVRKPKFLDIQLSPTGEYFAATVPIETKVGLVIVRRSDGKLVGNMHLPGSRAAVADFYWANDERVIIEAAERIGLHEAPVRTGELWAVDIDGRNGDMLVGQRVMGEGLGTSIKRKKVEMVAAEVIDTLRDDDKTILISVIPFTDDPYTRVDRMDVYTGRRSTVVRAPIRNASFVTDHAGKVRFASGMDVDRSTRLYYRDAEGDDWRLLNDSRASGVTRWALGFSADNATAYLRTEHASGPDAILAYDIASGETREIFRDAAVDPGSTLYDDRDVSVGVRTFDGKPKTHFFDPDSVAAKLYRKLERAFGGQPVAITSTTKDGTQALVRVHSDRNPGDYYLFNTATNEANLLLSTGDWIDPERSAATSPVSFKSRDGLPLHGLLTAPVGAAAKNAPMVVLIHGGPFGVQDVWGYNEDVQLLAAHGYAVLQVNFRGSAGYGDAFEQAGARQWGKAMQDDITDATRWAVEQGIADPKRICLFGYSYGGYASLMGAVREPALYACVAGVIGVYDLDMLHTTGDIQRRGSGEHYLNQWIGPKGQLADVSPVKLADRIKVPVLLAAGGEDERAPVQHTERMEKALREAGVPVEAHYYRTEGHGFYQEANNRDFYGKLLRFLQRHLGGRAPVIVTPAKDGKG